MSGKIALGSLGVSVSSHDLLTELVEDSSKPSEDRPFTAIVEAFRFAFALGYSRDQRSKSKGETMTIAPRQFVVSEYEIILRDVCMKEGLSLGALSSEYAEAGCQIIAEQIEEGGSVLGLIV